MHILAAIQKLGKFTVTFIRENSFIDSVQSVLYGTAQISLHPMTASSAWVTNPVTRIDYSFIYKSPDFQVLQTFFLDVFTPQFWFTTFCVLFLIILVGWIFSRTRSANEEKTSMLLLSVFVLTSAVWLPATKRSSFRFFLVVAGLFSFMFVSSFNLFLTSLLSTQTTILPFKTVNDIAEAGTHSLCMNQASALKYKFNDSKWQNILNSEACPVLEEYYSLEGLNTFKYACEKKVVMATTGVSKK